MGSDYEEEDDEYWGMISSILKIVCYILYYFMQ